MIINPYFFGGGGPPGGPYLDSLSPLPVAVHSLRKLISTATLCCKVKNSVTGVESDIGFSGDDIDAGALTTAGGANSLTVRTWYDQTGNGLHAQQATQANQPTIYSSGSYLGHVSYDGSNDAMAITSVSFGNHYAAFYTKSRITDQSAPGVIYEASTNYNVTSGRFIIYMESNQVAVGIKDISSYARFFDPTSQSALQQNTFLLQMVIADGTTNQQIMCVNGSPISSAGTSGSPVTPVVPFLTNDLYVASRAGTSLNYNFLEESRAIYNVNTSAIQSAIEAIVA